MSQTLKVKCEIGEGWFEDQTVYLYWVKPTHLAVDEYYLEDAVALNNMIELWMFKTFGHGSLWEIHNSDVRWFGNNMRYYFKDSKDRTLFMLRWS